MRRAVLSVVLAVGVPLLSAGPAAAAAFIHVSPSSVPAGGTVTVSGSVGNGCPQGDQVTLTSPAFASAQEFAGVPAVFGTAGPGGQFSASAQIAASASPGSYSVGGRCGGGNFGSAQFQVTAAGATLPRTGFSLWPLVGVGLCLAAAGVALRRRSAAT